MSGKLTDVDLVWGTPGDVEMTSDGGGAYASMFRLTPRGAAKIAKALGASAFRWAEQCGHDFPDEGDAVHVAGEPSDMICLASPIFGAELEASEPSEAKVRAAALAMYEWTNYLSMSGATTLASAALRAAGGVR